MSFTYRADDPTADLDAYRDALLEMVRDRVRMDEPDLVHRRQIDRILEAVH